MLKVIKSGERYHADMGWLSTYWHFSFADYHDPANTSWGPLRVFNDDVIQPGKGFGAHPHSDMEIITYVLEGELEHQDNQGNRGVIHPGEVQVMSAGTGIVHSEYNHSKSHPVHLLHIWIMPRTRGAKPRWDQRRFGPADRSGKLLPVVSGGEAPETLTIDQDAKAWADQIAKDRASLNKKIQQARTLARTADELCKKGDSAGATAKAKEAMDVLK